MKRKRDTEITEEPPTKRRKKISDILEEYESGSSNDLLFELGKNLYQCPSSLFDTTSYESLPISGKIFLGELGAYLSMKDKLLEGGKIKMDDWIIFSNKSLRIRSKNFEEIFTNCDHNADELMVQVGKEFLDFGESSDINGWGSLADEEEEEEVSILNIAKKNDYFFVYLKVSVLH